MLLILLLFLSQNAHAYVNAGFRMKVDPSTLLVSGVPSFVFGGISAHGVRSMTRVCVCMGEHHLLVLCIASTNSQCLDVRM